MVRGHTKGLFLGLLLALSLFFALPAQADNLSSIQIEVALQPDGSGIITETRDMTLTEGTEIYIPMDFGNMPGAEVTHFTVQENGVLFQDASPWNVDRSRQQKIGQSGIVYKGNTAELCWGIGEYGRHTYVVQYTISNLVHQLKDGQSLYWKFFNEGTNLPPENMTLTVIAPFALDQTKTKIWGFGFEGKVNFENGKVVAKSDGSMGRNEKVILLLQFTGQPFTAVQSQAMTLEEQANQARDGSSYYDEKGPSEGGFFGMLAGFFSILTSGAGVFIIFWILSRARGGRRGMSLDKGLSSNDKASVTSRNKDKYYRDIPYTEGPLTDVAILLTPLASGALQDYFNAFLLKWIKEGRVEQLKQEKGLIFKREESTLKLNQGQISPSDLEDEMWNMVCSAAGKNQILETSEFTRWAEKNYGKLTAWEGRLTSQSELALGKQGYVKDDEKKLFGFIPYATTTITDKGDELQDHIVQFKNYLQDFSLLNERGPEQVGLWDQLFIWAGLLGIAEEVAKQFQALYPQYMEQSHFDMFDFYMMSQFSNSLQRGYDNAATASSFSGGGGSTSFGGGGGSFGGGFGGGSR